MNFLIVLISVTRLAFAVPESMPSMPRISPKKIHTVTDAAMGQTLLEQRGFGDEEGQVRMMNLMMVEGSGMEGMDMTTHKSEKPKETKTINTSPYRLLGELESPKVGTNLFTFTVVNAKTKTAEKGMKLRAELSMVTMDMGTESPGVKEISPGKYRVKLNFSMRGPWNLKLEFPSGEVLNQVFTAE